MGKISVKSISKPLSNKEMMGISGAEGILRVDIWCTKDPLGEDKYYVGNFNACYFHVCPVDEGVLCKDVYL